MRLDDWSSRDHLNGNVKEIGILATYEFYIIYLSIVHFAYALFDIKRNKL